jgi:hypothetical protein
MVVLPRITALALLVAGVVASPSLLKRASGVTTNPATANGQTFDYIVVGGGLTGITVAARLAEDPTVTVLVVEVGADNRQDPRVYDIYEYGQAFNTELTWSWPADQGRSILGLVGYLLCTQFFLSSLQRKNFGWWLYVCSF